MSSITHRVALITGGSSGIGAATSTALFDAGFSVAIAYYSKDKAAHVDAQKLADKLQKRGTELSRSVLGHTPGRAAIFAVDVASSEDCVLLVHSVVSALKRIDVLVNCAAINFQGGTPILEYGRKDQASQSLSAIEQAEAYLAPFRQSIDVNFMSAVLLSQLVARQMLEQPELFASADIELKGVSPSAHYSLHSPRWGKGRIIHISSVHGLTTLPGSTPYVCSKHALEGLSKQLAVELGKQRITSNTICPGMTNTPATGFDGIDASEVQRRGIPMHRPCRPEEVAGAAVWLASTTAASTTGTSIPVDGGFLMANPQYPEGKLNDAKE